MEEKIKGNSSFYFGKENHMEKIYSHSLFFMHVYMGFRFYFSNFTFQQNQFIAQGCFVTKCIMIILFNMEDVSVDESINCPFYVFDCPSVLCSFLHVTSSVMNGFYILHFTFLYLRENNINGGKYVCNGGKYVCNEGKYVGS